MQIRDKACQQTACDHPKYVNFTRGQAKFDLVCHKNRRSQKRDANEVVNLAYDYAVNWRKDKLTQKENIKAIFELAKVNSRKLLD